VPSAPAPIEGWPIDAMEQIMFAAQQDIAAMVRDPGTW